MKKTYAGSGHTKRMIIVAASALVMAIILADGLINSMVMDAADTSFQYILFGWVIVLGLFAVTVGIAVSALRAQIQIWQEHKLIQETNPYKYYKELPNNYGVGVASLLVDSKIENEKDIVAAILDLCAQGYLYLSKHSDHYVIRMREVQNKTPLSNEAYILELIRRNNLQAISYQKWYELCAEDGIRLGLYRHVGLGAVEERQALPKLSRFLTKRNGHIMAAAFVIFAFGSLVLSVVVFDNIDIAIAILMGAGFMIMLAQLFVMFASMGQFVKRVSQESYKVILESHLAKTDEGVSELQKLESFRNFLAQFNTFVDKSPEAVVLWDRYLSYAQVFGLAKEILQSGYKQIIDNAAFKIDGLEQIELGKIEIVEI